MSDELTKPTRRLILLQMFTKQTRQNTTEKEFTKLFLLQNVWKKNDTNLSRTSINKSFSVYFNCTICELAAWHNCLNGRASFARRRRRRRRWLLRFAWSYYRHYFHLQLLQACLNLLHPTGKTENLVVSRPFFWHKDKSSKEANEVNRTDRENSANIWMISSFLIGW